MTDCVNKIVTKGISYGFTRLRLNEAQVKDQYSWSVWTVFVQSSQNHDMSSYVDHVTFYLHKDLIENVRTVYQQPYETTVFGALDSHAYIYIYFKDPLIPPQFLQILVDCTQDVYKKEIKYDNLIFVRPNLQFYKKLQIIRPQIKVSGILNHIQPELFKELYPNRKVLQYRQGMTLEMLKAQMADAVSTTQNEGPGVFLIDSVKGGKNAEKIIENLAIK